MKYKYFIVLVLSLNLLLTALASDSKKELILKTLMHRNDRQSRFHGSSRRAINNKKPLCLNKEIRIQTPVISSLQSLTPIIAVSFFAATATAQNHQLALLFRNGMPLSVNEFNVGQPNITYYVD